MNNILLMSQQGQEGSGMSTIIMMVLMIGVFYLFMIRPQMKKQKELKNFREALKAGDSVVTVGGIHGKISAVKEDAIIIKVEGGTTLKLEKSAVVRDFAQHQQQGGRK